MASGSTKAVYTAIIANSVVMVAKFTGFAFTGSGAMWETIPGDLGRLSTHYGFHSNSCITRYPVAVIPSRR